MAWSDRLVVLQCVLEFILKIVDSLFDVLSARTFVTGSANIFNSIAKVVVELLVTDKIPDLNRPTSVVGG
jgi:hypothetical protein